MMFFCEQGGRNGMLSAPIQRFAEQDEIDVRGVLLAPGRGGQDR